MSIARTARERVHEEVSGEILKAARKRLARDGAAALSLRSVARDLGLAPSALYRYYPSRDALLGGLILSAYQSLAQETERSAARARGTNGASDVERWLAVPRAVRDWALRHPHEWGLIFGTPVPGYQAPLDTIVIYARVATALVEPVLAAHRDGRLSTSAAPPIDEALRDAIAPVIDGLFDDEMPPSVVAQVLQSWAALIGSVSLELFGHWQNTVLDPALLLDQTMRQLATSIGLR